MAGEAGRRTPAEPRTLLAGALLVLAVLGAALAGPWQPNLPDGTAVLPSAAPTPTMSETPIELDPSELIDRLPEQPQLDPRPFVWVGAVLLAGLLAWLAHSVLTRPREDDVPDDLPPADLPADPELSVTTLRAGLAEASALLRREGVPSDAVVQAWVALERAAARCDVPRDPAATPTEFALAVLDRTSADRDATRSLLAAHERARFSRLPVTAADVDQAADDLRVLAETLHARELA